MHRFFNKKLAFIFFFILLGSIFLSVGVQKVRAQHGCSCSCGCDGIGNCNWAACGGGGGSNTDIRARIYVIDAPGHHWSRDCETPYTGIDVVGRSNGILRVNQACNDGSPGNHVFNIRTREYPGTTFNFELTSLPATITCADVTWELLDGNNGNSIIRNGTGCIGQLLGSNDSNQWRYTTIFRFPNATTPPPACVGVPLTSAPQNLASGCNGASRIRLSWAPDPAATYYSLRINDTRDPWVSAGGGPCPLPKNNGTPETDFCVDVPAGTTSYEFNADPYALYGWWIHSRDACDNWGSAVGGQSMQCVPNCANLTGPSTIQVGQTATFDADYVSFDGSLSAELYHDNLIDIHYEAFPLNETSGTINGTWVPGVADVGAHNVCCRAWNDGKAECRTPAQVDGPPRYNCAGPNVCTVVTVTDQQEWFKLKDTSFHRLGALNMTIPTTMQRFTDTDLDDTNDQYPIIGAPGVMTASGALVITSTTGLASESSWQLQGFSDDNHFISNLSGFVDYARARKRANIITDISQMQSRRVNIFVGNLTIDSTHQLPPNIQNAMLVVQDGDLTIDPVSPLPAAEVFNAAGNSIAFISTGTINVNTKYTELNGIFIASRFDLGYNAAPPTNMGAIELKINGNLISQNAMTSIKRDRPDSNRPSLFIVARPRMYIDLLPLLSTITQEGRQIE